MRVAVVIVVTTAVTMDLSDLLVSTKVFFSSCNMLWSQCPLEVVMSLLRYVCL